MPPPRGPTRPSARALERRVEQLERQAARDAVEIARLRQALAFAKSVILSGEPWTSECERVVGDALTDRTRSEDEDAGEA